MWPSPWTLTDTGSDMSSAPPPLTQHKSHSEFSTCALTLAAPQSQSGRGRRRKRRKRTHQQQGGLELMTTRSAFGYALQVTGFILLGVPILVLFLQLPRAITPHRIDPSVLPCKLHQDAELSNASTCVPFHRSLFPEGFVFGTATSSYQVRARERDVFTVMPRVAENEPYLFG